MTWREKYQAGRFRNAAFVTTDSGRSGGRRLATHEYPLRDLPYVEDLGRKARQFNLSLFVIGDDYQDKRDQLITALEEAGAGTLVHPYYGTMQVAVESYRVNETTREGGMASFDVTFIESGENTFPAASASTQSIVQTKSSAALGTIQTSFNNQFNVTGQPEFISTEAIAVLSDLSAQLQLKTTRFPTLPEASTDFLDEANDLNGNASTLILQPAVLSASIVSLVSGVQDLYPGPLSTLDIYRRFFNYGDTLTPVPATTSTRQVQANNQAAIASLVEQTVLIESAVAASQVEFGSFDEAVAVRDELDTQLDTQMLTADDDTYQALNDVRVAMINDITARSANLARTVNYTPTTTLPALLIAHDIYGDANQESEIVARNNIHHPGFIAGGEPLEVLTDVA